VTLPYPVEKRVGSPTPKAIDGYKANVLGAALGSLFGTLILVTPVVLGIIFTGHVAATIRMPVLLVAGAAYGVVLATIGVRVAARIAEFRVPEIAEIALRSKV